MITEEKVKEMIALNAMGVSLSTIAQQIGCHISTVSNRLIDAGVTPTDTRRAFMEDILNTLNEAQRNHIRKSLTNGTTLSQYIRSLIIEDYLRKKPHGL